MKTVWESLATIVYGKKAWQLPNGPTVLTGLYLRSGYGSGGCPFGVSEGLDYFLERHKSMNILLPDIALIIRLDCVAFSELM